jgi:methylthioribulose-1-phosphate dehydratase
MPDLRRQLAEIGRRFHRPGWMQGTAGNLSARAADGTMWVTASGVDKGDLGDHDFLRMTVAGDVIEAPAGRRPSAETSLHQAIYAWDDTQRACLHVHTVAANLATRLWDGPDLVLPPIEMLKGLGVWEQAPRVTAPVFENPLHVPAIAAAVTARFATDPPSVPVFLIRDHGITVWGRTIAEARDRVECVAYLLDYAVEAQRSGAIWWE